MKVSLSAVIMAHPSRAAFVEQLQERLEIPVVWDERNDRWDTGKRAMMAYDPACTHHVVVQDDIIPCHDLLAGLERALGHIPPDVPLCGYVGLYSPGIPRISAAIAMAEQRGASFLTMQTLNWGPLVAVPTESIEQMIAWGERLSHIPNYDRRLSRYWHLGKRRRIWYTWPSLVDHRVSDSLVPGRAKASLVNPGGRVAHTFIGEDRSAMDIPWTGPVVHAADVDGGDLLATDGWA